MSVKIPYYSAGSYQVKVNGNVIDANPWDPNIGMPAELLKNQGCGENRYVGIMNYLQFWISTDCTVIVEPRDAVHGLVRLQWTLEEFYAAGGVTRFIDRLASSLGIHRSRIKTMDVYEGSVIVDFFIESDYSSNDEPEKAQDDLAGLIDSLEKVISRGAVDFGAPILGLEGDGELLFGTPIPKNAEAAGKGSTAIRKDDNVWDRYVRI